MLPLFLGGQSIPDEKWSNMKTGIKYWEKIEITRRRDGTDRQGHIFRNGWFLNHHNHENKSWFLVEGDVFQCHLLPDVVVVVMALSFYRRFLCLFFACCRVSWYCLFRPCGQFYLRYCCHSCSFRGSITYRTAAAQPYLALVLKINLLCPDKELSSAESGNTGSNSIELLEVSESQQKTGCNSNTMLSGRETLRAAGQEGEVVVEGAAWGEARNREKCKGRGTEDENGE